MFPFSGLYSQISALQYSLKNNSQALVCQSDPLKPNYQFCVLMFSLL